VDLALGATLAPNFGLVLIRDRTGLAALIADRHVVIEGAPGTGKSTLDSPPPGAAACSTPEES
jgi:hypothetical protein